MAVLFQLRFTLECNDFGLLSGKMTAQAAKTALNGVLLINIT